MLVKRKVKNKIREYKWNLYSDGLTQSLLQTFLICPEKARLKYVEGLESDSAYTGSIGFGQIVHRTLEAVYNAFKNDPNMEEIDASVLMRNTLLEIEAEDKKQLKYLNSSKLVELEENFAMAEPVLDEYLRVWFQDMAGSNWIDLEKEFAVNYSPSRVNKALVGVGVDSPITIKGKFDGILKQKDGSLWLFETKTKSRIDEKAIVDRMAFEMQVCLYLWAAKQVYGKALSGVVYNIIRRPLLKQGKSETLRQFSDRIREDIEKRPEFYFMRYTADFEEADLKNFEKELKSIAFLIEMWYNKVYNFKNSAACTAYGRNCEFLSICSGQGEYGFRKRDKAFPELEGE